MVERNFIISGRNTIIHKVKKFDLLIINGQNPVVIVSHRGIGIYKGEIPAKRSIAKKAYQDVIHIDSSEVFGEEKKLLFIQALDDREFQIDYTKINTKMFISIHQSTYI